MPTTVAIQQIRTAPAVAATLPAYDNATTAYLSALTALRQAHPGLNVDNITAAGLQASGLSAAEQARLLQLQTASREASLATYRAIRTEVVARGFNENTAPSVNIAVLLQHARPAAQRNDTPAEAQFVPTDANRALIAGTAYRNAIERLADGPGSTDAIRSAEAGSPARQQAIAAHELIVRYNNYLHSNTGLDAFERWAANPANITNDPPYSPAAIASATARINGDPAVQQAISNIRAAGSQPVVAPPVAAAPAAGSPEATFGQLYQTMLNAGVRPTFDQAMAAFNSLQISPPPAASISTPAGMTNTYINRLADAGVQISPSQRTQILASTATPAPAVTTPPAPLHTSSSAMLTTSAGVLNPSTIGDTINAFLTRIGLIEPTAPAGGTGHGGVPLVATSTTLLRR